jgi:hypothetical protein
MSGLPFALPRLSMNAGFSSKRYTAATNREWAWMEVDAERLPTLSQEALFLARSSGGG